MSSTTGSSLHQPAWSNPHAAPHSAQEIHSVVPNQDEDDDPTAFLSRPYSTLTEPVGETIMRDVRSVWTKLKVVMSPLQRSNPLEYMYQTVSLSDFQQQPAEQDQPPSDGSSYPQEQEQEQDKIVGICRTADLYLKSAIFGSGGTLRERPKLNLTVKKELQNLGGKIIAQSCMAKGPDGSMGFHSGWTSRVSKFNMNETACRDELKNSDEEVHAS
mmetsp:Transcript_16330/g.30917  ORF Transcript_16330/g.30917 Transcript_16330/m.30917 type:complete len:215 (+) Transcript_16330:107-751(+)